MGKGYAIVTRFSSSTPTKEKMASGGGGAPGPNGSFFVLVDGVPLTEILANRECLARAARAYVALSDDELNRLRGLNQALGDQVAMLCGQVAALSAEVAFLRGQGPPAPGGARGRRPF